MSNVPLPEFAEMITGFDLNDRVFCIGYSNFSYFMLSYASVGSLGIAVYRVLYVKVFNTFPHCLSTENSHVKITYDYLIKAT